METTIYQIEFFNGSIFRVFCANKKQKRDFINSLHMLQPKVKNWGVLTNGIHTMKEWGAISKKLER